MTEQTLAPRLGGVGHDLPALNGGDAVERGELLVHEGGGRRDHVEEILRRLPDVAVEQASGLLAHGGGELRIEIGELRGVPRCSPGTVSSLSHWS